METSTQDNARGASESRAPRPLTVLPRPGPTARRVSPDRATRRLGAAALLLSAPLATPFVGVRMHAGTAAEAVATWSDLLGDAVLVVPAFAAVAQALDTSTRVAVGMAGDVASVWAALLLAVAGGLGLRSSTRVLGGALAMTGTVLALLTIPLRAWAHLGDRTTFPGDALAATILVAGVVVAPVLAVALVGTAGKSRHAA